MIKIVLALATFAAFMPAQARSAMSPEEAREWREDLHLMVREMESTHNNLFHTMSRAELAEMVHALDARIPSLERHEMIVELAKIVAHVGDGHTNVYPTRDPKIQFHTLPVAFTFFSDGLYVRAAAQPHTQLLGSQVVRIGDRSVADAYTEVKQMIGCDNDQGAHYWAQYLLAMPEVLHAFRITRNPSEVPLTLATNKGEQQLVLHSSELAPMMHGDIAPLFNKREGWTDLRELSQQREPLWLSNTDKMFYFEHVGSVLYVQINQIGDMPGESFAQFAERLRDEIAVTKPQKLVIDLRLNRGGNNTLIPPLVRTIIQSTTVDQPGRLFVIIGPATFSAAQNLVNAFERYTQVTFVGEPTGSRGNTYGDSRKITLPNSGITARASVYYWQDWYPWDTRVATLPQLLVPLSIHDYSNNIDPVLQAIDAYSDSLPQH